MTSVAIIGGGFWGGAIQRHLQSKVDVNVFDPGEAHSGSSAAQGLVRLDWLRSRTLAGVLPEWWGRAHDEASEGALVRLGAESVTELVTSYNAPGRRAKPGLLLIDPSRARADVHFHERVLRVEPMKDHVLLRLEDEDTMFFSRVVIAAGVWTDQLLIDSGLQPLGVGVLAGSTLICHGGSPKPEGVVWSHGYAPYKHITARPWGRDQVQVGATVSQGNDDTPQYDRMLDRIAEQWPQFTPEVRLKGWRPVGPHGRAVVTTPAPNVIVAVGGSRIGLALAGGIARRVEEML